MDAITRRIRHLRIGPRLLIAFGVMVALIGVNVVVGLSGSSSQSGAATQLSRSVRLTREAMQVKFRGADFNGWQTAYAFDIIRGLKGATADNASSRSAFLHSAASFRRELGLLSSERLTPAERTQATAALRAFDAFMATDVTVIADYRLGTPQAIKAANALVLGREITLFGQVSTSSDQLVALIKQQSAAA